jgi:hypothetical protein
MIANVTRRSLPSKVLFESLLGSLRRLTDVDGRLVGQLT